MNTNPSIDAMLEGVILALGDDIMPELANPKAQANAAMMQAVLQGVRQMLPDLDHRLVEEHNAMLQVLKDVVATLGDVTGDAADRVRERAARTGERDELPAPLDRSAVEVAHHELGASIASILPDLDELQRAGVTQADDALQVVRGHLGPRFTRDASTAAVGDGLVGRG